jgi:uncharacterized membrane protein
VWFGVEFAHALDLHVAMLELPVVVLLEEHGADEAREMHAGAVEEFGLS